MYSLVWKGPECQEARALGAALVEDSWDRREKARSFCLPAPPACFPTCVCLLGSPPTGMADTQIFVSGPASG